MLRPPVPNADRAMLEHCKPEDLLDLFETCLKTRLKSSICRELPDAWSALFTELYLSADDLMEEMAGGRHRLPEQRERMLREFIALDCATGGSFVLDVIWKGGMTDRAALIMIADPDSLAALEHSGTTAIHMLADACHPGARPALIKRAGVRLLSEVYDRRGIPVLLSIFALGDLGRDDLDAIRTVFSEEDLRKVMNRNRTGKNALEIFDEASERLKVHAPGERNKFFAGHGVRTATAVGEPRSQADQPDRQEGGSGEYARAGERKNQEKDEDR